MAVIDKSLLPSNTFRVVIGGPGEYLDLNYFAVSVTLPGIQNDESPSSFRNKMGYVPSETLKYDTLSIRFACDEKMGVYQDLHDWMKTNTTSRDLKTSTIEIHLMTSHNNVSKRFICKSAFPTSIGSVEFNAQSEAMEYASLDVSFRYDEFSFED
jgi:hypothetical protein